MIHQRRDVADERRLAARIEALLRRLERRPDPEDWRELSRTLVLEEEYSSGPGTPRCLGLPRSPPMQSTAKTRWPRRRGRHGDAPAVPRSG
ncbi:hypothetical protein [Dactylosporangium sp. CA-139066]|uniref:hypothetical protein n=1 Tax=Dactylosporangium sp. CA-139066 TaxID=3239930 RepID=UPI003D8A7EBF